MGRDVLGCSKTGLVWILFWSDLSLKWVQSTTEVEFRTSFRFEVGLEGWLVRLRPMRLGMLFPIFSLSRIETDAKSPNSVTSFNISWKVITLTFSDSCTDNFRLLWAPWSKFSPNFSFKMLFRLRDLFSFVSDFVAATPIVLDLPIGLCWFGPIGSYSFVLKKLVELFHA